MKELSIEQKARAYDEAKARMSKAFNSNRCTIGFMNEIFPELKESEDEKVKRIIHSISSKMSFHLHDIFTEEEFQCFDSWSNAWLEKQGDDGWGEGDVVRHGGILALVTNGRNAIKSNLEQITIQYPDEWVKAHTKERKYFFDELEKQGKKPQGKTALEAAKEEKVDNANKVEPKFHKGDWVTCDKYGAKDIDKIVKFDNDKVSFESGEWLYINQLNEDYKLWTIQDAKPGDALVSKNGDNILIFRNLDTNTSFSSYYNIAEKGELGWSNSRFIPATKEQRDILFKKMKEAGYEWDVEMKKLRKIE